MTVTREQFDAYAAQKVKLDSAIELAIDELWDSLDTSDLAALETDLAVYLPLMADRYGKACAVVSADFYNGARAASKVRGGYKATTDKGQLWHVDRDVRYAFGGAFAYASRKDFLTESVKATARDYGRATIEGNSRRDPFCRGYDSVPTNSKPCVFCIMKSLQPYRKYGGKKLDYEIHRDAWHNGCRCELIPVWKDSPHWVEGMYEKYEGIYRDAREWCYSEDGLGVPQGKGLTSAQVQAGMRAVSGIQH